MSNSRKALLLCALMRVGHPTDALGAALASEPEVKTQTQGERAGDAHAGTGSQVVGSSVALAGLDPVTQVKLDNLTVAIQEIQRKLDSPKPKSWFEEDVPIVVSVIGLCGSIAALILNARQNARTLEMTNRYNERTLREKSREEQRESIRAKLDEFYGPFTQLRGVSQKLYELLNARHKAPDDARYRPVGGFFATVPALLGDWVPDAIDKQLLEEIAKVGDESDKLIAAKIGLVDDRELQAMLWKAATHYRLFRLAKDGHLKGGGKEFTAFGFPFEIDERMRIKVDDLNT